jgi:serine/threonine protein kinase
MRLIPGFLKRLWGGEKRRKKSDKSGAAANGAAVYKKGDRIGSIYEVLGVLGVGGFSVVYLVHSRETGTAYALKTLRDEFLQDADTREQFRREAKVWIDLERHPYLVRAHFIDELGGRLYIGMEYIAPNNEGLNTLQGYLQRRTPDLHQSLRWAIQFCHGMEYALSKGIRCHRDVKPANIMITSEGTAKITDFGFADVIDLLRPRLPGFRRRRIPEHTGFGTPVYMPPEQFQNAARCDARSDIYSFGVVLYQMASRGRLPFTLALRENPRHEQGPALWRGMHKLHAEAAVPPLSSPLFPIIHRCMEKEPSRRYQTFKELRLALEALLKKEGGGVVESGALDELAAWELYNKAFSLSSLGHIDEAIQCYDRVLELEPGNSDAWNNKGVCYRKGNRNMEALACYNNAIKADPHNAAAWSNKGNALYTLGRFTEAIVALNKAIDIDALNESAWLHKAVVEDRLGLHREAAASYRKFLALPPAQYATHIDHARKRLAELERS